MTEKEAFERFLEFEEQHNLFERKYRDFDYWIYIRHRVYNKLIRRITKTGSITPKMPITKRIKASVELIFNALCEGRKPRATKADVVVLQHPRKVMQDGEYIDVYTSFLNEAIAQRSIFVDDVDFSKSYSPLKYQSEEWNLPLLLGKFNALFYRVNDSELRRFASELQDELSQIFDIKLRSGFIISLIAKHYALRNALRSFYTKRLTELKPKVIVEVVFYALRNMVINEVAASLGIATIELQHGTMGSGHIDYNYRVKGDYAQLPDYVYLFSEFWRDSTLLPQRSENIKITGFPYFESQLDTYCKNSESVKGDGKRIILFISQATISRELSQFAVGLSQVIDLEQYEILYKLHPAEVTSWQGRLPELYAASDKIRVVSSNKESLYSILAKASAQVGVYSTAIYEGVGFNLRSYIVPIMGYSRMEQLIEMNYAQLVNTPDELVADIERSESSPMDGDRFWSKGAAQSIVSNIESLLE